MAIIDEKNQQPNIQKNYVRRRTDFLVLLLILGGLICLGELYFPERSSAEDIEAMEKLCDPFNLKESYGELAMWLFWYVVTVVSMHSFTWLLWLGMYYYNPQKMPTKGFLAEQIRVVETNFFLLPLLQVLWDFLGLQGYTKATMGNLSLFQITRDCALWMLCFEWAWYFQHRAMHDFKFLWKLGHSYHHTWRRPEHMLGITNFAFDHIVEFWVTMSSSFLPYLIFPSNFYVGKFTSLFYMVLAVLAHWDGFGDPKTGWGRYHLGHHYLVTKNYGSHIPIFDIMFGTYAWTPAPERIDDKKSE